MQKKVGLLAVNYVVGELAVDVESISNKQAVLKEFDMPDIKGLWEWGHYRKTEKSHVGLAVEAAARTLERSGMRAADIDGLVFCCGDALNYYAQNRILGDLSVRLELSYTFTTWVGGAGCASLFSAILIAESLVNSNTCRNVLVVTVDKIQDDVGRFQRFGVLSDGACSFIVSHSPLSEFTLESVRVRTSAVSLGNGGSDFSEKCQLIYSVFDEMRQATGVDFDNIGGYFGSNVFIPVQELELSVMPIDGMLAYQQNTARYGHCYASDPIINLVDFYADAANSGIRSTMMASSAHGHFGLILLDRKIG